MSTGIPQLRAILAGVVALAAQTSGLLADQPTSTANNEMRPAVFDWAGPYGGLLFSLKSFEASVPGIGSASDGFDGDGRIAGIVAGYNFVEGNLVWGIEGDAGFGQLKAVNRGRRLKADAMTSLRLRFGRKMDDTLIYSVAGVALAGTSYTSSTMTSGRNSTHVGLLFGAGIEHAIAKRLSGRIEYVYGHPLKTSSPHFEDLHMIRAGAILHLPK